MSLRKSKKERIDRYTWLIDTYCFSEDVVYNNKMLMSILRDLLDELGYSKVIEYEKNVEKLYNHV